MARYLVAGYLPDDFDPSQVDEAMGRDYPRAQQNDDCRRRQEIRLRPWGREVAANAGRWRSAHHRRAIPRDQGTHRRFLDIGMRRHGRGGRMGAQRHRRHSGAGRGARYLLQSVTRLKQLSGLERTDEGKRAATATERSTLEESLTEKGPFSEM